MKLTHVPKPAVYLRRLRPLIALLFRLYDHAIEAAQDDMRNWGYKFDASTFAWLVRLHVKHGLMREKRRVRDVHEEWLDYDQHWPPNNGLCLTAAACEIILLRAADERADGERLPIPQSQRREDFYNQQAVQLELELVELIAERPDKEKPGLRNVVFLYQSKKMTALPSGQTSRARTQPGK